MHSSAISGGDLSFDPVVEAEVDAPILIAAGNNLNFNGGDNRSYSQLGNGGFLSPGQPQRNHHYYRGKRSELCGWKFHLHSELGDGGGSAIGDHSGTITLIEVNDLNFVDGFHSHSQLGHGGTMRSVIIAGRLQFRRRTT